MPEFPYEVGDRVRFYRIIDMEVLGTVVGHIDTPNFGTLPMVAWDDAPEHPEPEGPETVRLVTE